jgi:type III secretory pathway component EscR
LYADFSAYKKIILNQKKHLDYLKKYKKNEYRKYLEKQAQEKEREKYLLKNWNQEVKVDKVLKTLN